MGGPKALLRDADGVPYLDRAVGTLFDGGCEAVSVVLGAAASGARSVLLEAGWSDDAALDVVVADDWEEGMGASLRTGLRTLNGVEDEAVLVTLVDLPDVDSRVVGRVAATLSGPGSLTRATYAGKPGHPVLIGRDHWAGVISSARGDQGARSYLASLSAEQVLSCECSDLASGRDLDTPADLR
jgi:CTP:molybdopterin cytidylyltransferase MocA